MRALLSALAAVSLLAACERWPSPAAHSLRAAGPTARSAPNTDSIYRESVARFRAGLTEPGELRGGARSREAVVRDFVRLLAAGDTAGLAALRVTRAEFAFLLYPSSPYVRAPYRQQPEITWTLFTNASQTGFRRLVERMAGERLQYASHQCPEPVIEGANRYWRGCRVTIRSRGDTATARLFGGIVERGGTFKLESFANDF